MSAKREQITMAEVVQDMVATRYAAVRDGGAGLIDLSSHGRLLISGVESVTFLNGLITNDMNSLTVNSWMPAAFPNVQGRLLGAVRVIHRNDGFLIDTESVTHEKILRLVERFTPAGDFHVTDITHETALLSVQGRKAEQVIRTVLGEVAANVERQIVVKTQLENGSDVCVIRATHTAEDGFDLFVGASEAANLWDSLVKAGAQPIGLEALETLRIEAGIPRYGKDMDETTVVSEANLDEAVSFTKGCYVGQEIIARIKYRGHVAKKLTGLVFEGELPLESGAKILSVEDQEIGRVTSLTFSPRLDRSIALGYVKYDYLAPGTHVKVSAGDDEIRGTVADLPFVRGSWYAD